MLWNCLLLLSKTKAEILWRWWFAPIRLPKYPKDVQLEPYLGSMQTSPSVKHYSGDGNRRQCLPDEVLRYCNVTQPKGQFSEDNGGYEVLLSQANTSPHKEYH